MQTIFEYLPYCREKWWGTAGKDPFGFDSGPLKYAVSEMRFRAPAKEHNKSEPVSHWENQVRIILVCVCTTV